MPSKRLIILKILIIPDWFSLFVFIPVYTFFIRIIDSKPPINEATALIKNKSQLVLPVSIIENGSKSNRPKDLMIKILSNTPAIEFPTSSKEYFLNRKPVRLAPNIPIIMLINAIKVFVIGSKI